jgi:hypothetical protein
MRYLLPIHQNAEAWSGLSQEDKDVVAGDVVEELSASRERVVATSESAARRPDARHWGMEIRALAHGGGQEG